MKSEYAMHYQQRNSKNPSAHDRAAVLVDYDNLFSFLYRRCGPRLRPDEVIDELLHNVRQYVGRELGVTVSLMAAYADFAEIHSGGRDISRSLYLSGVEPRFVPASMQRNAAELQLTMDAMESSYTHPDLSLIVIVSADRPYLPLIKHSHRMGRQPLAVMLRPPADLREVAGERLVIGAEELLSDATVRGLGMRIRVSRHASPEPHEQRKATRAEPVVYRPITHRGALAALEVIDEHFGQYSEIYLTPLLRKLSEVIGDEEYDPKSLITEIEEAGAVWLEKRKGFPYNYTVLIIDPEHPDVKALQEEAFADSPPQQAPADMAD